MANFEIGDRVRIIVSEDADKTGVIIGRGDMPDVKTYKREFPPTEIRETSWWKVRLDGKGGDKDFPDDTLAKIE